MIDTQLSNQYSNEELISLARTYLEENFLEEYISLMKVEESSSVASIHIKYVIFIKKFLTLIY